MSSWGYARLYARMYGNRLSGEEKEVPVGKVFSQNRGVLRQVLRFRLHWTPRFVRREVCWEEEVRRKF
jgi:hypothetical protein